MADEKKTAVDRDDELIEAVRRQIGEPERKAARDQLRELKR